jgi:hypothetical protein
MLTSGAMLDLARRKAAGSSGFLSSVVPGARLGSWDRLESGDCHSGGKDVPAAGLSADHLGGAARRVLVP